MIRKVYCPKDSIIMSMYIEPGHKVVSGVYIDDGITAEGPIIPSYRGMYLLGQLSWSVIARADQMWGSIQSVFFWPRR